MAIRNKATTVFKYGTIDTIEDFSIPRGAASRSLNWLTKGDHIELRRGFLFMGDSSVQTGSGKATGLKKCTGALQVEILFYTYGQKLKYFDESTDEWVEVGSSLLGTSADGDDISLEEYVSNAGNQLWVNSPDCAGYFKIMVANPGSSKDNYDAAKNYKGHIKIDTNSTFLWLRNADKTTVYRSYIDAQTYTTVTAEALASVASGTLAAVTGKRTCFAVAITHTASGEVYTDKGDGTLTGSSGGTGTINYSTGAYTTNRTGAGTATYQWEDSTSGGIADFTGSTAGQGTSFQQSEGGGQLQTINSFDNVYYCMHARKTWALTLAIDDTPASTSNVPYRENVGIPNLRASVETGEGIYYIDNVSEERAVRLLTYERGGSQKVIPVPISNNIDLDAYEFDQAAGFEFGDWVLFSCRRSGSSKNDRTLAYNRKWKTWDLLDYAATCFDTYNSALVAGDAFTNNVMELFSGLADDDAAIVNYWEGSLDDLDIEGLKKTKKFKLEGLIGPDQKIKVSLSLDSGPFVEIGHADSGATHTYAIEGGGTYVDHGQRVAVGSLTLGRGEVAGGSTGVEAYHYEREFKIGVDKFERAKIRFEAMDVGFASVSLYDHRDVRFKGKKTPRRYRG